MAETLTIRTASSTEVVKIAVQGPQGPKGDKGDPGDVAGLPLTTQGDTLYRGASENQRLPIGTTGQILKVSAGGIPEWGSAPATGVTSVTGTAPITSSGGNTPAISISEATTSAAGSMSAADKTKLDGIAAGAEVNVNADWNASSGDAQILNKPTLGGAAALNVGTTTGTVAAGDDARLSNSRTPTAHAASHAASGSDALNLDASQITSGTFNNARINFAAPASIGSSTPNSGAFTTLNANTSITGPIGATVGSTSAPAIVFGHSNSGIYVGNNQIIFVKQGVEALFFDNSARVNVNTTGGLQVVQTDAPIILTRAISLFPDATNGALAQRSGTQAQEYRVYATHTSSTNYQRMTVKSVRQTLSALSGASATTTGTFIPDGAVVVGITTRVATAITGATGYLVGDGTDSDRWGDITGTAIGTTSDNRDWTAGTIECFTAGGNITLTAKTSNFTAGAVEICVFYLAGEAD